MSTSALPIGTRPSDYESLDLKSMPHSMPRDVFNSLLSNASRSSPLLESTHWRCSISKWNLLGPLCTRRQETVKDNGSMNTNLTGEESQICLLGGCLLITYVPWWPRSRVMTPLYRREKVSGQMRSMHRASGTHNVLDLKRGIPMRV
jgi:hypothetical protein